MLNHLNSLLFTTFFGTHTGEDLYGNQFYFRRTSDKEKRWVIYKGMYDPSKISAEWHSWLHFITNIIPSTPKKTWHPNTTGTKFSHNSISSIENIPQTALQYYESWTPDR